MHLLNLLMIDRDDKISQFFRETLAQTKEQNFLITCVNTIDAAWEQLDENTFSLIIVADSLGDQNAVEFIHQCIVKNNHLPVLFIADSPSDAALQQAVNSGAADALSLVEITPALLERSISHAIQIKQSQKAFNDSEERFYLATRAVNGVVYDWDLATNRIFRSDGLQEVIGVLPSEISPEHGWWEKRVHPEDIPKLEKTIVEKIEGGARAYELEYRVKHLAGYWIDVWEQAYILRDSKGKAHRVVGTRTNITDRKRNESNARFLADLGEQMLTLNEPQEMFAYASEALMRHLDLDRISFDQVDQKTELITILYERHLRPPAITGTHPFSPFHKELQKRMIKGQAMVVADTSLDPVTAPLYEEAFSKLDLRSFVSIPRLTEAGWVATMNVVVGYVRHWRKDEIALLKQSSDLVWLAVENARLVKQLRAAQERFEIALKNSQMTIYTTDLERRYTWVANSELNSIENPMVGKRDEEIFNGNEFREVIEAKKAVLASGVGIQREFKIPHQNKTLYIDMTIEPLRNASGEMEGLIVAASDKTQRREFEQRIQQTTQQIEIQRRIEQLREEERQQIARNLHDGPIQGMIGLLFSIESVQTVIQDAEAHEMLVGIQQETQKLVSELRNVCNELRPPVLVQFGLSSAIRAHANDFQQKHPEIKVLLELSNAGRLLSDNVRLTLYRIYQEAINNVVRHANATEIKVSLSMIDKALYMEITDNGDGFDMPGGMIQLARDGHFGLVGMQERVESIGGILRVSSQPGSGTVVTVHVPVLELAGQHNQTHAASMNQAKITE